jgi:hypothetical protein
MLVYLLSPNVGWLVRGVYSCSPVFFNDLTDPYYYAASALAAAITQSCFGAGFPLFTHQVRPSIFMTNFEDVQ